MSFTNLFHLVIINVFCTSFTSYAYDMTYSTPHDCGTGLFYDASHMECVPCPSNGTEPAADKLSCVCKEGWRKIEDFAGVDTHCEQCPAGQTATPDGWGCAPCDARNRGPATGAPSCANCINRLFSISRNVTGYVPATMTCALCRDGTRPVRTKDNIEHCAPCNPSTNGGDCPCPLPTASTGISNEQSGGLCFRGGSLLPPAQDLFQVQYDTNTAPISSSYFNDNLRAAFYMCKEHKNFTACQAMANLCVLLHYNRDSQSALRGENACDHYVKLSSTSTQEIQWQPWVPFIINKMGDAPQELAKTDVDTAFSFAKGHPMSFLNFTAAVFALNGTFLGMVPVKDGLLQLCKNDEAILNAAYRFGRKYKQTCQLSMRYIWDQDDVKFYDLYLVYPSRKQQDKLAMYYVPILNLNYVSNFEHVNEYATSERWQLVRRMFLVEAITGRERLATTGATGGQPAAGGSPNADTAGSSATRGAAQKAKIVRYAKYIGININLQNTKDGRIYPPLVRVRYGEIKLDAYDPDGSVSVEFEVNYMMSTVRHEKDIEITMGTLCSFGTLWAIIRAWSWSRRSGQAAVDFVTIIKFLIFLAATISNIFLIVLLTMSLWMLVLYKCQKTPVMVMPTAEQEYSFLVYFGMAVALKCIEMVHLIIEQVTTKVFFIDWERPRGYIIPRSGETTAPGQETAQQSGGNGADGKTLAPVTIWRTYMVANEWNEFQTHRKTSYVLQLFAMVFFLKILSLENLALIEPGATIWNAPKEYQDSRMSRFAVATCAYLSFGFFQWFINVFIVERCVVDHFRNFMDLCSISNVSVIVLLHRQFGYYIHGRSVHGHADTNMHEMNEMLQRERENMCTQRGLEPNTERQCFVACLPNKFREQYDRLVSLLKAPGRSETRSTGADPLSTRMDHTIDVYTQMNQFLAAFADHLLPEISYVIKDRLFLEAVFDMEFTDNSQKGSFYRDSSDSAFSRVFYYGNEWTLLTFDMLIFCAVDMIAHDFLLAAFVTYLIVSIVRRFRQVGGKKNIVKTSLVDERFLI